MSSGLQTPNKTDGNVRFAEGGVSVNEFEVFKPESPGKPQVAVPVGYVLCVNCQTPIFTNRIKIHSMVCGKRPAPVRTMETPTPRKSDSVPESGTPKKADLEAAALAARALIHPKVIHVDPDIIGPADHSGHHTCPECHRKFLRHAALRHVPICRKVHPKREEEPIERVEL